MADTNGAGPDDFEDELVDDDGPEPDGRGDDFSTRASIKKQLLDMFNDVEAGFTDQNERANAIMDYWDVYNCKLTDKQFYNGNSQIFVPIVHNAINARKTRFTNQIFPQSGRYIEVTTDDGTLPQAEMSLIENYVRLAKLRTKVMPALCRSGDIEGQYNVYVSWEKSKRHIAKRTKVPMVTPEGLPVPGEQVDDIAEEEVQTAHPEVEVLSDTDVLVLPATSDGMEEAIAAGGSVTILRRWGKAKLRQMAASGILNKKEVKGLISSMSQQENDQLNRNKNRQMVDAAGIKIEGNNKYALVYEMWSNLRIRRGEYRLCVSYYGGEGRILGSHRNPLWCDRLPVLSAPVEKVAGSFKGVSKVKFCADMQYAANDATNEGMDSAAYALMPIVMTDPASNPRVGSMVLAMAAIWETSPKDTQFAQMPPLWQNAFEIVNACKQEVQTTLSVSPAAITGQNSYAKLTQAQIANEQQVDILTTADATTVIEEAILTPMVTLFAEMDHQYRNEEITVRAYGEMGLRANMESIPPLQMDNRYSFRWFGVEAARNAQQIQQQIAGLNVVRGIPPQQYQGYQLDLAPAIVQLMENTFGPRLAPLIFKDIKQQLSIEPEKENAMLAEGFDLPVHPLDEDPKHIQAHMQAMQGGDQHGTVRSHILRHQQSMQIKAQAAMIAQAQGGMPGEGPGGPGGQPGQPRIGAQPGQATGGQNPPGSIHPDNMIDAQRMPQ